MSSNYPTTLDDDSTLPGVYDNITEVGGDAINAIRSAVFSIESEVGLGGRGSLASIADRIAVSIQGDGTINPSALVGIGLVSLPITNDQISPTAAIQEGKLSLSYSTTSLYNYYAALKTSVDILSSFLSLTGIKLQPHIDGTDDRHLTSHIDVDPSTDYMKPDRAALDVSSGTSVISRDRTNLDTLLSDISDDLTIHEKSDGTANTTALSGGTVPPENFAHNASGIYVNTRNFSAIPQSNTDIQKVISFIDSSSLLLLGSRTQNLFSNGVSRGSRSTPLLKDGYGAGLVPPTPATAYHLNNPPGPTSSIAVDDISHGDDVILFNPTTAQLAGYVFDSQFALVRPGDLLTMNYGTGVSFQFVIDSTKDVSSGTNRTFAVRINGRNPYGVSDGYAQIDRAQFNRNKHNALASVRVPNSVGVYESLIIASPRGAMALGANFNPSQLSGSHYRLYLGLLQNGDLSSAVILPGIDITGNKGTTPGKYTLDSIIDATNTAFRSPGFNYRFVAFKHDGQFGIALADHYHNTGFTIVAGNIDANGNYTAVSNTVFNKNVIDNFYGIDPLGFGVGAGGLASPPPNATFSSATAALRSPTVIFSPLKKNFFYVNGAERDTLYSDPLNLTSFVDTYGDGYWPATVLPSPATQTMSNRIETVYKVSVDVNRSGLAAGKTIVVQPNISTGSSSFNLRDYGRYTIKTAAFYNCGEEDGYANITVYDGVHAAGTSPAPISTNIPVNIYFSDDSVGVPAQNIADTEMLGQFKRYFESYVDKVGHTFMHERARFLIAGNLGSINITAVSPKLRGYDAGQYRQIRFKVSSYDDATGEFSANLGKWDPGSSTFTRLGPTTTGKKGEMIRVYDETNIDFIEFVFDLSSPLSAFTNESIDIHLFRSLELNQESMLLSTFQMNDATKKGTHLQDRRQFGNISEEHLSTSALDYIASVSRHVLRNRTVRGFDNYLASAGVITLNGGVAIIDGKVVNVNNSTTLIPVLRETNYPSFSSPTNTITWVLCANKQGQIELVADTTSGGDRVFYVSNPMLTSPVPYAVRSAPIATIISDLTDLTPLYSVVSVVAGSGITWSISSLTETDVRVIVAKV